MELALWAINGGLWGCVIYFALVDPWFERREKKRLDNFPRIV
ncbi:hypothetical protein LCGC14_0417000 [marine sediment metagenome]|uniref:Uncharacterized protein n=1 Tax=marine sediment metagenome TaxID=412755 RepID=A0A0F9VE64_9ZZZZ